MERIELEEQFLNPDHTFRGKPFWSWILLLSEFYGACAVVKTKSGEQVLRGILRERTLPRLFWQRNQFGFRLMEHAEIYSDRSIRIQFVRVVKDRATL